jgi:hypothetical protein
MLLLCGRDGEFMLFLGACEPFLTLLFGPLPLSVRLLIGRSTLLPPSLEALLGLRAILVRKLSGFGLKSWAFGCAIAR